MVETRNVSFYMSLIGVLRWLVDIVKVDVWLEASEMSSFMEREGHLERPFYMFMHLKKYHNTKLVFDSSNLDIDMFIFQRRE